ncbi:hypothetical protein FB451DRAFT_188349 [Mycena latifolia]|nr:hypothetical protein FB451DRAFT_188349 [Mycena latifolia]
MSTLSYVDKIPTEIWLRCWVLCPNHHLRRLTLVCRYFRNLCLSLLFQHQTFSTPHPTDVDRDSWITHTLALHRSYLRLGKLAASTYVSSVRSWDFRGSSGLPVEHRDIANIHLVQETYLKVLRRFTSTLGLCHKIQSLRLDEIVITPPFRKTLTSLMQLDELKLNDCTVTRSPESPLLLRKFAVTGERAKTEELTGDPLELVASGTLSCLKLDGSPVGLHVLSALAHQTFTLLIDLTIDLTPPVASIFFTSIVNSSLPRLEHLHITHLSRSVVLPTRISSTALAALHSFKGPRELLPLFVPGRPVVFIRVSRPFTATTPEILSALADISRASATPHVLELHPRIDGRSEVFDALTELLPDLRQLSFELNEPPWSWPPLVAAPASVTGSSEGEWEEEPVDERTVELSDDGTLEFVDSDVSDAMSDYDDGVTELPTNVKAGYMYVRSGKEFPPPDNVVQDEDPQLFPGFVEEICAGRVQLPPYLEELGFRQPEWTKSAFTRNDQHRVLLRLGARHPALREIAFTRNYSTVWRRCGEVWTQRGTGRKVIRLSADEHAADASGLAEGSLAGSHTEGNSQTERPLISKLSFSPATF